MSLRTTYSACEQVAELEAAVGQLEPTDPRQRALYRQRALAARHQAGPPAGRVVWLSGRE